MIDFSDRTKQDTCQAPPFRRNCWALCALVSSLILSGCQSMTNPLLDGVPARRLPPEYLGRSRESLKNIPLSLLRQRRPDIYLVDSGDILGIFVEKILPK